MVEQSQKENDNPWEYDLILINDAKIMAKGKKTLTNGTFSFARIMKNSTKPTQYYVADASYLNLLGKPVFYSNHPIQHLYYSHKNTSENGFLGKVEGSFQDDNNVVSFFLDPSIQIQKVMLDNKEIQFRQHTEKVTIDIPSGKHFLTFE